MFTEQEKQILRNTVTESIKYGLEHKKVMKIDPSIYPANLQKHGASFITIEINGKLRGCIGCLEACQPLILDIVYNSYCAAFCDPRFPPLTKSEFSKISKHISILSCAEPIIFSSEEDLLSKIRPKIDGLILTDQGHCGTFLPSVWESLHTPKDFLECLKLKAGFSKDYWSDTIKIERYTVELIT